MATMLEKMFHEYIVRPAELKEFEDNLAPHQKATGERGDTLLQKAVRDHNVGACGKVCWTQRLLETVELTGVGLRQYRF